MVNIIYERLEVFCNLYNLSLKKLNCQHSIINCCLKRYTMLKTWGACKHVASLLKLVGGIKKKWKILWVMIIRWVGVVLLLLFFVLILLIHFNFLHTHQKRKGHLTKILAARKRGQPPSPDAKSQGNLLSIVFSLEF